MPKLEKLQRLFDRLARNPKIHSIVVAVDAPGLTFRAAEGHADGVKRTPMRVGSPYHLASITKLFTSVATLTLTRSGQLDIDAPIATYLDESIVTGIHVIEGTDHGPAITSRHLLSQTSGLADYFDGSKRGGRSLAKDLLEGHDRSLELADVLAIVRELKPAFPPGADGGTRAHYSDTNFQLLAAVIESITSKRIVDSFEEHIFTPLGLKETFIFDQTAPQSVPAALWNSGRTVEIPLAMSSFQPDGGGVTTAAEAMRFLRAFFESELLTPDEMAMMTRTWNRVFFPFEYGLGIQRFRLPRLMSPYPPPPTLLGHAGSTGSFSFFEPNRQAFIVGTVNQADNPSRPYRMIVQMMHALR